MQLQAGRWQPRVPLLADLRHCASIFFFFLLILLHVVLLLLLLLLHLAIQNVLQRIIINAIVVQILNPHLLLPWRRYSAALIFRLRPPILHQFQRMRISVKQ